jgi:hypothetical protein
MGHALEVPDVDGVLGRADEASRELLLLCLLRRELLRDLLGQGGLDER